MTSWHSTDPGVAMANLHWSNCSRLVKTNLQHQKRGDHVGKQPKEHKGYGHAHYIWVGVGLALASVAIAALALGIDFMAQAVGALGRERATEKRHAENIANPPYSPDLIRLPIGRVTGYSGHKVGDHDNVLVVGRDCAIPDHIVDNGDVEINNWGNIPSGATIIAKTPTAIYVLKKNDKCGKIAFDIFVDTEYNPALENKITCTRDVEVYWWKNVDDLNILNGGTNGQKEAR
jgi:hypothetical protein